ncbi:hypothetical protein TREES_T100020708 [Tupaia chinensis]|uniref:Uncharacterized protein n=1 Tax=Tupaia chinensis TaxID=246437 RepID=L9KK49_TUPCH|nr:hypothetical protein TREES_T100020708 [Tupaia chinensis]
MEEMENGRDALINGNAKEENGEQEADYEIDKEEEENGHPPPILVCYNYLSGLIYLFLLVSEQLNLYPETLLIDMCMVGFSYLPGQS